MVRPDPLPSGFSGIGLAVGSNCRGFLGSWKLTRLTALAVGLDLKRPDFKG
jgi:hypothetical protein